MKRDPALQEYSRDHHLLLLQARAIRWHFAGNRHAAPIEEVVAAFLDAWEWEIDPHLREEEVVLLPWYEGSTAYDPEVIARVQQAHSDLREQVVALRAARDTDGPWRPLLRALGEQLHDHVRWEERFWFPMLQAQCDETTLAALGARVARYRASHRPHARGPRG